MEYNKPDALILTGNLAENWRVFREAFEIYIEAAGLTTASNKRQVAIFLNLVGKEGLERYNTLTFDNVEDNKKIEQVLNAFQDYCKPKKNILHSRYIFYKRSQKENESIEEFLSACRGLIKDCEFKSHQEILRDKIVLDTRDGETRDKLIKQADVTLETAIETLRIAEIQLRELNQMKEIGEKQNEVNAVHSKVRGGKRTYQAQHHYTQNNGNSGHRGQYQTNHRQAKGYTQQEESQQVFKNMGNFSVNNKKMNNNFKQSDKLCKFCNFMHGKGKCPAYGKKCLKCNKFNHFKSVCKSEIAFVENVEGLSNDSYFCSTVYTMNTFAVSWSESILVENKSINFKLDTGSDVNLLTLNDFNLIKNNCPYKKLVVNRQPINLLAYGGSNINTYFTVDLKVKLREKEYILNFVIVENHCKAILGLHSCINLGLINKVENVDKILSLNDVLENYSTVFTGLGNFPDKYSIQLKPDAIPVTNVPHRVPINIQDKLKCELDRLVSEKIIREINEPTEWVNRLVIVEKKNGSMRLCLDPRDLNENIIREYCVIPTLSDLSSKLKNARVFSVFDLKDGFWQIKLDLESSKLCTFGTMFGTFCFNRLPFGINNAAEICQKWNMKVFGGIENVFIYLDDILIFGDTEAQHDCALKQVLDLAMKNNIKFNKNKIQYKVDKVNYLGHIFSYEGMKLDNDRIKSIFDYETPKSIKDLQRFLGMVNYVGNFIPNLAMLTKPLRDLLKKNNEFVWTSIHNECVSKLKTLIASPSVLRNYDNTKDVIIQTDSSKFAIGCVLLQEGRPVCFKSKSLSETEINYGQVDKEFLSVLFACKVFHHYIYGRRVTVQTDHLPLISLMKKNINDIPSKRLQCIKVKLSRYDINLIHVPGKKMFIADALSRACILSRDNDVDIDVSDVVHSINMSKNIRNEFVQETIKDDLLKQLVYMCKNGWPKHNNKVSRELISYFNMRYQISFDDDLLFLNNRVFVPMKLQNKILFKLHEAHLGICKTKTRARSLFYWKGLDKDIEEYIGNCAVCNKFRSENTKDPMICQEVPNLPFEKVACDILDYGKDTYLVLVDYYSGWLELNYLSSKTSSHIIKILKVIFSIHGIPKQLVADNMPFNSNEFQNFATDWEFVITTSSPRYPKSNGLAEKGVSIAKSILKRSDEGKVDKQLMLLEYRNSAIIGSKFSPAQLLMSRTLRSKIPILNNSLKPTLVTNFKLVRENKNMKTKLYYDKNAKVKNNNDFQPGQKIMFRDLLTKTWKPGKIINKYNTPRSYVFSDDTGKNKRRNIVHLRPAGKQHRYNLYKDDNVVLKPNWIRKRRIVPPTKLNL
uniref:RNA-directed DNA polymerase n=1 Tax=Schizaphis graminum TaxID=13262 RepID=A0A2S2PCF5_SCHGA